MEAAVPLPRLPRRPFKPPGGFVHLGLTFLPLSLLCAGCRTGMLYYPCQFEHQEIAWDTSRPMGFSAIDVLGAFPSRFSVALAWGVDAEDPIPVGWLNEIYVAISPITTVTPSCWTPAERRATWDDYPCHRFIAIPVEAAIASADGGLLAQTSANNPGSIIASSLDPSGLALTVDFTAPALQPGSAGTPYEEEAWQIRLIGSPELMTLEWGNAEGHAAQSYATGVPEF